MKNFIKYFLVPVFLLAILSGCKKEDYTLKPPPFADGSYVRLDGIDPSKSFEPHCGTPATPFKVTSHYLIGDYMVWWFDLKSDDGCILTHIPNTNLKKW